MTQNLPLHPDLNALVTLAFLSEPTLQVTNVAYGNTAYRRVNYILHVLGHTPPPAGKYPPYKADRRKGQLVHGEAFMTHVKHVNPTLTFVDQGSDPHLDRILADDPALVGKHHNQTELNFPWLLEFSADVLPSDWLIEPKQAPWTAFAVYIPKISTLIPFNVCGVGYQLGTNLIGETPQTRLNRLLGRRISPHPADSGIDKRKE